MTIQEAIQKAVDGGYQVSLRRLPCFCHNDPMCIDAPKPYDEYKTLIDPSFWQSLSKSMEWGWGKADDGLNLQPRWQVKWHRLIDHLASGKSIEDYFKNL